MHIINSINYAILIFEKIQFYPKIKNNKINNEEKFQKIKFLKNEKKWPNRRQLVLVVRSSFCLRMPYLLRSQCARQPYTNFCICFNHP